MWPILQRLYSRQIAQAQPSSQPLLDPLESEETTRAKLQAQLAKRRAEEIIRTLTEPKPIRPAQ